MAVIIRLQNLPLSANAATIRSFFQGLKIPDGGVNIVGGVDGDAFIAFGTDDDARQAMHLSGQKINGSPIKLLLSSKSEMQSIITDAQKGILKRVAVSPSPQKIIHENIDKKSITYYDPTSFRDSYDLPPSNKMRVIDHSIDYNEFKNESNYENFEYINKNREINDQNFKFNDNHEFIDENQRRFNSRIEYHEENIRNNNERIEFNDRNNKFIQRNDDFFGNREINNKENARCEDPPRPSAFSYNFAAPVRNFIQEIIPEENLRNFDIPHFEEYRNNQNNNFIENEINNSPFDDFISPHFIEENRNYLFEDEFFEDNSIHVKPLLPTPKKIEFNQFNLPQRCEYGHHDYSIRPPWLEESSLNLISHNPIIPAPIKPRNLKQSSPKIRNKSPPITKNNNKVLKQALVKIVLPTSIISAKTVFDLFRNISVVPKRGIKMEIDIEKRLTGYVYILLTDVCESEKALKLNNKPFRGITMSIESLPTEDFEKVVDRHELDNDSNLSPYNRDLCVEISNVPSDINETDLKDYLNISINNKKINFFQNGSSGYCLIMAEDEAMFKSILKFNGVSYRGCTMKVVSISKHQLETFLTNKTKEVKHSLSKPPSTLSCLKVDNINDSTRAGDLKRLFLPSNVPLQNIIIKNMECVVDLISSSMCQKVLSDLKRKPDIDYTFTPITNVEFQTLKSRLSSTAVKSVPNIDKVLSSRPSTPSAQVRIKNFPTTVTNMLVKDFIRNFKYQPRSIRMCYEGGKCTGEVILTFKVSTEAVDFKDAFHGTYFKDKKLEVLLSEN